MPLEISKICYYFITHGGEISGTVEDSKPRRSPILSGGLEVKLKLTFKSSGDLVDKLKILFRQAYTWDYTGNKLKETKMKMRMIKKSIFNQISILILIFFNFL